MSSANKFEEKMKNNANETRVALLEQSIGHINETLIRLEKKVETGFIKIDDRFRSIDERFIKLEEKFDKKFSTLHENIKSIDSRLWTNFYWTLGAMFTLTGLVCGIMAKGFGWVH